MGVYIRCGGDIGVTQPFLYIINVPTLINQYASRRMTQVVISHLWETVASQSALKTPCEAIGPVGHTIRVLEDIIVNMVSRTKPFSIVFLLFPEFQKELLNIR
jgi:hypothetical protein